ncbi:MAG: hypothetical protein JNM56_01890 [Planctomycetia bacterium]|nr:hypothetical protein [Planctomycetia bacterium]
MLIRPLLYLCGLAGGLAWFFRAVAEPRLAFAGENAVLFLVLTVALGFTAVGSALDQLIALLEQKHPGRAAETVLETPPRDDQSSDA